MSTPLTFRCPQCGGLNRVPAARLDQRPSCGRCHTALDLSGHPLDVDDDTLDRLVAASPVPVLVDFWAAWCGPCRTVAPHLEALARTHAGKLVVVKVDVDRHGRTAQKLGVQGIPTLAVWKDGKLQRAEAGARTGPTLAAFVAPYLGA